jgi:hypothetical protein
MKYVTDSQIEICGERLTEEDILRAQEIAKKFKVNAKSDGTCGNVRVYFDNNKAMLSSDYKKDGTPSYRQISSALALYRAVALFKCGLIPKRVDHYKLNWYISLTHKKTKEVLGLGEWKGGFQIFTEATDLKDLSDLFVHDCEQMLTLLVSQKCPIGYDGVVAGSVA